MNNYHGVSTAGYAADSDDGFVPYRRWVACAFSSLVDLETRMSTERALFMQVCLRPYTFTAFVAGVVTDLLHSLPAEDPWRHTEKVDGIVQSVRGAPFGTHIDALDLLTRANQDLRSDPGLVALATPLSEWAALVIHLCAQSRSDAFEKLNTYVRHGMAIDKVFADACAAIRWAIHRREVYVGADDAYSSVVVNAWVRRARNVEKGLPWDEARRARLAIQEQVPHGLYEIFTSR